MMVMVPSSSVRVTRRPLCSQDTSRPSGSTVLPFELNDGVRNTLRWLSSSSSRIIRLFGMSLKIR